MKKKLYRALALLCSAFGTIGAVYVGGWMMFLMPLHGLYNAFCDGTITFSLVVFSAAKIILSATFAGLVWCIGYIGSNYFKGDEDPDWSVYKVGMPEQNVPGGGAE